MPGDDEIIIRNGTLWQWLNYEIVFGGKVSANDEYGVITGGIRIKGKYFVIASFVLGAVIGAWV